MSGNDDPNQGGAAPAATPPDTGATPPPAEPAIGGTPSDDANPAATNVAAGGTYNVYIVDKLPSDNAKKHGSWDANTQPGIVKQLGEYFEKIADKASFTGSPKAKVNWVTTLPTAIKDDDLAVYLLFFASSRFGADKSKAHGMGMTGWRNSTSMLSEVWVDKIPQFSLNNFIDMLSKLIFHEWMHQKMDAHPNDQSNDIHNRSSGLGKTPVDTVTDFSDSDRDDMAAALNKAYKQMK